MPESTLAKPEIALKKGICQIRRERKARRNRRLCHIVQPKTAIQLLHELKPESLIEVVSESSGICTATVKHCGKVWGTGSAKSKNAAKHIAAEKAIKNIVKEIMGDPQCLTTLTSACESKIHNDDDSTDEDNSDANEVDTPYDNLPWATLASLALHRMFFDWKINKLLVAPTMFKQDISSHTEMKNNLKLPENAEEMHPVTLLNQIHTGIQAEVLQTTTTPNVTVTMGYKIYGQLYSGTASNKKTARKIAAKHVCMSVYGVKFK